MMKGIMVQGTSSDVGKSLIAAGICRILANEGVKVTPFKSQNMSNNSYVTLDGQEIGRAQGIQAEAARTAATVMMNPILLKPRSEQTAEIVLFGKVYETLSGKAYRDSFYDIGLAAIRKALDSLAQDFDFVVIEGAGSPVEMNLNDKELVNMKVAGMADVPVILVADIDRGGVFASIVGTLELLASEERERVRGIIINKFRGDISLFSDGIKWIEAKTGVPVIGVLPYLENHMIDGEDSLSLPPSASKKSGKELDIAVMKPAYLSNYNDIEPFYHEEDVRIRWVSSILDIGSPDAVILPGTKSTIRDLQHFKLAGFDKWLSRYAEHGGYIVGLCGGYQMLGERLIDHQGYDTGVPFTEETGFGLIPCSTSFLKDKTTIRVAGSLHHHTGMAWPVSGYQIHLGKTEVQGGKHFLMLNSQEEGYYGNGGQIIGTYLHHLFHNDQWRTQWLNSLRNAKGLPAREPKPISTYKNQKYEDLAQHLLTNLDWPMLKLLMEKWGNRNELS
jgi:adenosylcobyric acid synthase